MQHGFLDISSGMYNVNNFAFEMKYLRTEYKWPYTTYRTNGSVRKGKKRN